MRKSARISILIIILLVIAVIIWRSNDMSPKNSDTSDSTPIAVSETTKVSSTLSEYQNAELGFSVKYPSAWQREEANSGVTFIIPIAAGQVSSIGSLQSTVQAFPGTCAFPPVTTIKERSTLKVGESTLNMISMTNTVQGRTYFDRMYSLQKGDICYMFRFASITLSPASKGLKGSNITQAENNNKALINNADTAFTDMVKSFTFVTAPKGQDETKVPPVKTN